MYFMAVYTEKEPDEYEYAFADRWKNENYPYYKERAQKLMLIHYYRDEEQNTEYLSFIKRFPSLYDDYRAQGCIIRRNDADSIVYFSIPFVTPMVRKENCIELSETLFDELVSKGNVNKYLGNKKYLEWPTKKVFYDTTTYDWEILP
jgi:hypothetical protein